MLNLQFKEAFLPKLLELQMRTYLNQSRFTAFVASQAIDITSLSAFSLLSDQLSGCVKKIPDFFKHCIHHIFIITKTGFYVKAPAFVILLQE